MQVSSSPYPIQATFDAIRHEPLVQAASEWLGHLSAPERALVMAGGIAAGAGAAYLAAQAVVAVGTVEAFAGVAALGSKAPALLSPQAKELISTAVTVGTGVLLNVKERDEPIAPQAERQRWPWLPSSAHVEGRIRDLRDALAQAEKRAAELLKDLPSGKDIAPLCGQAEKTVHDIGRSIEALGAWPPAKRAVAAAAATVK